MKLSFFLISVLFSLQAQCLTIVSDLDDTIKITHGTSIPGAVWNGLFTTRAYTGMPQFLQETEGYADELHVLTGSMFFLRPRIWSLLNKHGIDVDTLITKRFLGSTYKYKVKTLTKMLAADPDETFIFFGDDVGKDPEVFEHLMKSHPGRILAAYIHVVRNREVPASAVRYWTAAEIAIRENLAGRMSEGSVQSVLAAVEEASNFKRVIPNFADCPGDAGVWEWQLQTAFAETAQRIINRLTEFCAGPGQLIIADSVE